MAPRKPKKDLSMLNHLGLLFLVVGFVVLLRITDLPYALAMTSLAVGVGLSR